MIGRKLHAKRNVAVNFIHPNILCFSDDFKIAEAVEHEFRHTEIGFAVADIDIPLQNLPRRFRRQSQRIVQLLRITNLRLLSVLCVMPKANRSGKIHARIVYGALPITENNGRLDLSDDLIVRTFAFAKLALGRFRKLYGLPFRVLMAEILHFSSIKIIGYDHRVTPYPAFIGAVFFSVNRK